jgi:Beta-ketoacyl synthase, N-terminal domain
MRIYLDGIGVLGPGISGWQAARTVLRGDAPYRPADMSRPSADLLPPAERRRCGDAVKLALHVGIEALHASGASAANLPTVFTSSSGNGEVLHEICETLASAERDLSPTRFHNSVHNAPAGYWSIATGAREPSASLCADRGSFTAGLLEAALLCLDAQRPVLMVSSDTPNPPPLSSASPIAAPFGVALLVNPTMSQASSVGLDVTLTRDGTPTALADTALEQLRQGNTSAQSLVLLAAIASGRTEQVTLEYLPQIHMAVAVGPCATSAAR